MYILFLSLIPSLFLTLWCSLEGTSRGLSASTRAQQLIADPLSEEARFVTAGQDEGSTLYVADQTFEVEDSESDEEAEASAFNLMSQLSNLFGDLLGKKHHHKKHHHHSPPPPSNIPPPAATPPSYIPPGRDAAIPSVAARPSCFYCSKVS